MIRIIATVVLLCLASGCAPHTVKNYAGAPRPSQQISTLHHYPETGLKVFEIDGKYVQNRVSSWDPDAWREVQVLPGDHSLSGGVYLGRRYALFYQRVTFVAGKTYKLSYETVNDEKVRVFLVEDK